MTINYIRALCGLTPRASYATTNPAAGPDSIVIDDDSSTGITFEGNWQWRDSAHDKYGPGYHFAHAGSKGATAT